MRTLAEQLLIRYGGRRFGAIARVLNERAALYDGLFESNIEGRPYVGFNAVVLTADERDRLARLTEIFNTVMTKALTAVVQESSLVLRSLGWPENLEYYLRHEPVNRFLTPIGRFDFALDTDGEWRLMEFNSDTPSGAQEVTLVEERQWPHLARLEPGRLARLNPAIASQLTQSLYEESPVRARPARGRHWPVSATSRRFSGSGPLPDRPGAGFVLRPNAGRTRS